LPSSQFLSLANRALHCGDTLQSGLRCVVFFDNGTDVFIIPKSRQEVCESFDWFRSYQSGVYFSGNTVKGYLLSAFSSRFFGYS
jgi:hypothetical protein